MAIQLYTDNFVEEAGGEEEHIYDPDSSRGSSLRESDARDDSPVDQDAIDPVTTTTKRLISSEIIREYAAPNSDDAESDDEKKSFLITKHILDTYEITTIITDMISGAVISVKINIETKERVVRYYVWTKQGGPPETDSDKTDKDEEVESGDY